MLQAAIRIDAHKNEGGMHKTYPPLDLLASWREGVPPMRILVPDLPVRAMDNQFGTLVSGNLSGNPNSFLLRGSTSGCSGITFPFYLPTSVGMGGNMLIFGHFITSTYRFSLRYSLSQRTLFQAAAPVRVAIKMRSLPSICASSLSRTCTQFSLVLINQVDSVTRACKFRPHSHTCTDF